MRLRWIWCLLGMGLFLTDAPVWGETASSIVVDSPASPLTPSTPLAKGEVPEGSFVVDSSVSLLTPPTPLTKGGVQEETFMYRESQFPPLISPLPSRSFSENEEARGAVQKLSQTQTTPQPSAQELDLKPEIRENSPVLQRWLRQVPNVLQEIRHEPSFRTRVRLSYSQFPSTGQAAGFNVGVEDVFIGRTGLTMSGDYQRSFNGKRESFGTDLRYYVFPLGSYVNVAPQVGYRNLTTGNFSTEGVNVGARLMLALSRTGAADVSLTQSFVSPGSRDEVGMTTLSFGYAVTQNLRLSTDIQKQNSREDKDSRVGIVLEWMP
ncbi:hypothetical protein NDI39_01420 [Microcoleus sp. ZQ-A2]|nr:hypothetical protein [Microcoleus sp. FACHB-1]